MKWQPIEVYDAMKKKPKNCAFFIAQSIHPRSSTYDLSAKISIQRNHGSRITTHFIQLPDKPIK